MAWAARLSQYEWPPQRVTVHEVVTGVPSAVEMFCTPLVKILMPTHSPFMPSAAVILHLTSAQPPQTSVRHSRHRCA